MALSNRDRVGRALDLLKEGLRPFVEREFEARCGAGWAHEALEALGSERDWQGHDATGLDVQGLLTLLWNRWNEVFAAILSRSERNLVSELREVRNRWAHQEAFSTDDAYRALDSVARLLSAVSAPEAEEVERQKTELLRQRFEEQARQEKKRASAAAVQGSPLSGLKPWREVVTPHPDVASGRYQQAEFMADLWQIYRNEGADEYRHPVEFFRRTFLTEGLSQLLVGAIRRLAGEGGDPVVELQTNFGGGKTHSMLALYHLFSGVRPAALPGLEPILKEAGVPVPDGVQRAVLVGTRISPGQAHRKPDGTLVHTLWGELAYQLAGRDGYELVRSADETSTSPGDALRELFEVCTPCLILIDEWVAYARQLYHKYDLPAGSFEAHFTFAQALTEAAKHVPGTLLVVSVPASENEIGGEGGETALARLKNAIGRVESPWRPASTEEGFEIVRRRLFQPITDPALFRARDVVVRAFGDLYRSQASEFPTECREADYERRLQAAYPIHPDLFDRLYTDWSSLDKFQRTRGVLRLMAAVIHELWERQDSSLLIMPASVPIDATSVLAELQHYLDDPWATVIETDVDGPHSLPLTLDRENPNLGRFSASRRVARAVFLGSAPTLHTAHRGLEDRQVKLGCVQPGESVATFGDALRRLTDGATHLYVDDRRYWYSTQPNVTRLARDRAAQLKEDAVLEEMRARLRQEANTRGDFARVHACPSASGDVPDEREVRLVILGPEHPHTPRNGESRAVEEAARILDSRGTGPRICRNTLVFLAGDRTRLSELDQAVRLHLAWNSICRDHDTLNLDVFNTRQAETRRKNADDTVKARIPEAYQWLLVPVPPDPQGSLEWQEMRLQGQDSLAVRAARKLKNDGLLMTQFGATLLRLELDRIPLWRGDHVSLKQLAEDFAQYLYLPRLKNTDVLLESIQQGLTLLTWEQDAFAYAAAWDATTGRYRGLLAGQPGTVILDGESVLVKPDVALQQLRTETPAPRPQPPPHPDPGQALRPGPAPGPEPGPSPEPQTARLLRRFHGSVPLDATRLSRDAADVAQEVVQHLAGLLGAKVEITLEIRAEVPYGVPDHVVRTVTENCHTLRFTSHGFEEE
ncbi:MAG: ATP-binding protein [Armatimonadetes bacterium]|nr:ATP-binding protein [Armatimonadota bacterium]